MLIGLATGLGLGLLVAAQVGPIWLLCARSSLRHGTRSGLGIGAGAAVVDLAYAALGVAGAASILRVGAARVALGVVGAAVLLTLGGRTLWHAVRVRQGGEADAEVLAPAAAFRTALGATASNPATVVSWAAIFGAASVAHVARTAPAVAAMLAGVGCGSFVWFAVLSTVAGRFGRRLGPAPLRVVDALAGTGITGFGGLLAWRTLRE